MQFEPLIRCFHRILSEWKGERNLDYLLSAEPNRNSATFPLRDETGTHYQLDVTGRYSCLMIEFQVREFKREPDGIVVSRQRLFSSSILVLKHSLDRAVSTIKAWMAEHGAKSLEENVTSPNH